MSHECLCLVILLTTIQGGPKSKALSNDQKVVVNHIKTCE